MIIREIEMEENEDNTFYFVVFVHNNSALTVIDLSHSASYERSDWAAVNDKNFHDRDEVILYARKLATKYKLKYEPFRSRYNSALNERNILTLDDGPQLSANADITEDDIEGACQELVGAIQEVVKTYELDATQLGSVVEMALMKVRSLE